MNNLTTETDSDAFVWRYMSLDKFKHLIRKQSVYMRRLDRFKDSLEGTIPPHVKQRFLKEKLPATYNPVTFEEEFDKFSQSLKTNRYASCWRRSASESSGAWAEYCKLDEGVVVKSSVQRLVAAFEGRADIVTPRYIDWEASDLDLNLVFHPSKLKCQTFEHEQEIRIVGHSNELAGLCPEDRTRAFLNGCAGPELLELPVELDELVIDIRMHPCSSEEFKSRVRKAFQDHDRGLAGRLRESALPCFWLHPGPL